jgi:protein farnesyltransferase subunit beta
MKLQQYVLVCGQDLETGGLRDKPGKGSDFYHSCYAASGLALSQGLVGTDEKLLFKNIHENQVNEVDPVFNVDPKKLAKAKEWFKNQPPIVEHNKKE